jgi:tetratricopeptide (TPR) repeat protein
VNEEESQAASRPGRHSSDRRAALRETRCSDGALDPTRMRPYILLARAFYLEGKPAEALDTFEKAEPGSPAGGRDWLPCAEVRAGRRNKAEAFLQNQLRSAVSPRQLASTYSCLGDEEHALEYLEKMLGEHDALLAEMLQAPEQAWMRPNPRFAALRKQVNLRPPQRWSPTRGPARPADRRGYRPVGNIHSAVGRRSSLKPNE